MKKKSLLMLIMSIAIIAPQTTSIVQAKSNNPIEVSQNYSKKNDFENFTNLIDKISLKDIEDYIELRKVEVNKEMLHNKKQLQELKSDDFKYEKNSIMYNQNKNKLSSLDDQLKLIKSKSNKNFNISKKQIKKMCINPNDTTNISAKSNNYIESASRVPGDSAVVWSVIMGGRAAGYTLASELLEHSLTGGDYHLWQGNSSADRVKSSKYYMNYVNALRNYCKGRNTNSGFKFNYGNKLTFNGGSSTLEKDLYFAIHGTHNTTAQVKNYVAYTTIYDVYDFPEPKKANNLTDFFNNIGGLNVKTGVCKTYNLYIHTNEFISH